MLENSILKCQFCGTEGTKDDFELDFINHNGFWCPNCDGHTFFNNEDNIKRKFTLILEDKSNKNNICYKASVKFNKRLSSLRYPGGKSKLIDYLYSKLQSNKCKIFIEPFSGGASVGLALLESKIINHLLSRWNPINLFNQIEKIHNMKSNITVLNGDALERIERMYYSENTTIFIDSPYYGKRLYNYYFTDDKHISLAVLLDTLFIGIPGADIILTYDNQNYIEKLYSSPFFEKISRVYSI